MGSIQVSHAIRVVAFFLAVLIGTAEAARANGQTVAPARQAADVISQMVGGAYRMRGQNIETSVTFISWELENRIYSMTTILPNRRVLTIGRIQNDGTIEFSAGEAGAGVARILGNGSYRYEGTMFGRPVIQTIHQVGPGRFSLIHERNGRAYPTELELITNEEALRLASRLYPAEYGQRRNRSSDRLRPSLRVIANVPQRNALVVGIGDYRSLPDLRNPTSDAREIALRLTALGYHVELVLDPTRTTLHDSLVRFRAAIEAARPGAPALFYYAGHAVEMRGRNYLLPSDMPGQIGDEIGESAVALDWVVTQMPITRGGTRVVIVDACRDAPIRSSSLGRGLALFSAPEGTFIAYSTAPGMVAADGLGRNSPFAIALVEELNGSRRPIEEIFRRVRRSVITTTGGQQIPWDSSSLLEPFSFRD